MTKFRSVCHIVRRFGSVGGMESYVYSLAHAQISMGYDVMVIAEEVLGSHDGSIEVKLVERTVSPRRWRQMLEFRTAVDAVVLPLREMSNRPIIHSHERSSWHDVSTFHGPPMDASWPGRMFSPRVKAWREMEQLELSGPANPVVVPVSNFIKNQISRIHPSMNITFSEPGYPAIDVKKLQKRLRGKHTATRLCFVGNDWKRKGLPKALEIFKMYRDSVDGEASMDVIGVPKSAWSLVERYDVNLVEWVPSVPFGDYDAIIHPANNEPFGMVVGEALNSGCRVLCSERVGAIELFGNCSFLDVIELGSSPSVWVDCLARLLKKPIKLGELREWTWLDLAKFYDQKVYDRFWRQSA